MLGLAVVIIGYAAASFYSDAVAKSKVLGVALAIGPLMLIGVVLAYRWSGLVATLLLTGVMGALAYHYLQALETHYEWLDLVQQCAVYGLLSVSFARSLLPGQVPLCTELAVQMHGTLTPIEGRYTRRTTLAWAIFYLSMVAAIIVIFQRASHQTWSLFVNFAAYGLILLMVIVENWWRRRVLPARPSVGLIGILQRTLLG